MKLLSALVLFASVLTFGMGTLADEKSEVADLQAFYPRAKPNLDYGKAPSKVDLTQPAFMATITSPNVILKWKPSPNAKNYHLQVATDPNFKWLKVDEHMLTTTEYEVRQLDENKHYYWRVAPENRDKMPGSTKGTFAASMFQTK